MNNEMQSLEAPRLCLPLQVAPVERKVVAAALSGREGVDPSFDFGSFLSSLAPVAAQVLPGLLSAI